MFEETCHVLQAALFPDPVMAFDGKPQAKSRGSRHEDEGAESFGCIPKPVQDEYGEVGKGQTKDRGEDALGDFYHPYRALKLLESRFQIWRQIQRPLFVGVSVHGHFASR